MQEATQTYSADDLVTYLKPTLEKDHIVDSVLVRDEYTDGTYEPLEEYAEGDLEVALRHYVGENEDRGDVRLTVPAADGYIKLGWSEDQDDLFSGRVHLGGTARVPDITEESLDTAYDHMLSLCEEKDKSDVRYNLSRSNNAGSSRIADVSFDPRDDADDHEIIRELEDTMWAARGMVMEAYEHVQRRKGRELRENLEKYTDLVRNRTPEERDEVEIRALMDDLEDALTESRLEGSGR